MTPDDAPIFAGGVILGLALSLTAQAIYFETHGAKPRNQVWEDGARWGAEGERRYGHDSEAVSPVEHAYRAKKTAMHEWEMERQRQDRILEEMAK